MQKLFQAPMAPVASRHYSRQLFKLAVVGIVLGAIFLMFWQAVLQGIGPATWDEQYCRHLLGQYESAVLTDLLSDESGGGTFILSGVFANGAKNVQMIGTGDNVATCSITIISDSPTGDGFANPYNCTLATIRYKTDTQKDWLMTAIQTELIPEVIGTGTLGRFTTTITYYNPAAQASFSAAEEKLEAHSCEV